MPASFPPSDPIRTEFQAALRRWLPLVAISLVVALAWLGLFAATASASHPNRPNGQPAPPDPAPPASVDPNLQLSWLSPESEATRDVAWGDMDGDGDLDLAVGNSGAPDRVILNQNGALSPNSQDGWVAAKADNTTSLAWGDVDGDGDLDLVVGNEPVFTRSGARYTCTGGQEQLYRNDDGKLTPEPVWSSSRCDATTGLALGDLDGDGDPDLAVSNAAPWQECETIVNCRTATNLIYRNDNGIFTTEPVWASEQPGYFQDLAWGDIEGDGDLDLAVASMDGLQLYLNDAGQLRTSPVQVLAPADMELWKVEWGDLDGQPSAGCDKPGLDLVASGPKGTVAFTNRCGVFDPEPTWRADEYTPPIASLALGDADSDGDLDLVTGATCSETPGGCQLRFYRNDQGQLTPTSVPISTDDVYAFSLAWGDVDNDGDLDLAVGAGGYVDAANRLYRNLELPLASQPELISASDDILGPALAWGDSDSNVGQDLAIGQLGDQPTVWADVAVPHFEMDRWHPQEQNALTSLAWGDVDGDGDLDLAVGNTAANCPPSTLPEDCDPGRDRLYLNTGGFLEPAAAWTSAEPDQTTSLAWGDVDGDGALDLAAGTTSQCSAEGQSPDCEHGHIHLFSNAAGELATSPSWTTSITGSVKALAWGDVDDDGDLDLAVASEAQPVRIYLNEDGALGVEPAWTAERSANTVSLAWGDVDGDGDLDLVVGNIDEALRLYLNTGGELETSYSWSSLETHPLPLIAWGDVDGDGDLDLAVNDMIRSLVYVNDGGILSEQASWSQDLFQFGGAAWADVDVDGDMDLSIGRQLFLNVRAARLAHDGQPIVTVRQPGHTARSSFYFASEVMSDAHIPFSYTLSTSQPDDLVEVRGYYSVNGPGAWQPATPVSGTQTTRLEAGEHTFLWDAAADGLLGQSDNVVLRLVAIPHEQNQPGSVPGPFLHGSASDMTAPFRVRGTQVRVFAESEDNPVADAVVYRLPAGQIAGAQLLGNNIVPFRTNAGGYLLGRGEIEIGDSLVALWRAPDGQPESGRYTVYYTNARPNKDGLDVATVQSSGVQTLTVSSENPLILFDLDVSLEWDAREDTGFLQELEQSFQRASEILYDVSDGQMALGDVRVWQNKENWLQSDVVIYASGSVRPRASLGGVVDRATDDVGRDGEPIPAAFLPGQVRMGPVWDPFGQSRADLGRDWWRALAHELSHHLLYLPDDYLGYGKAGNIIKVDCQGSIMTTAYDDAYGEFLNFTGISPEKWPGECKETLAAKTTGRSDWETVQKFYPSVIKGGRNPGPAILPLAVTRVLAIDPLGDAATYPARNFDLRDIGGNRLVVPQGQGYLVKNGGNADSTDDILVPLGTTGLADFIKVRGAAEGDRLCLFDFNSRPARLGCIDKLGPLDNTIQLAEAPGWAPDIQVAPVQRQALEIRVVQPFTGSHASVTAIPFQPGAVVSVTQLITRVALVEVSPTDGTSGFSIAISPTIAISEGQPGFQVVQLAGGSLAITTTSPLTPDLPVIVSISQPAMLITVTQAITHGQLRAQVLPAYGSWSSVATPMTPAATDVFTTLVPLDLPVYSGFARTLLGEDHRREAITQFYFSANRRVDGSYVWGDGPGVTLGPNAYAARGLRVQLSDQQLAGLGPNDQGGYGPNDQGGYGPNDQGGYGPNDQGGYGPNDQGGYGPNDQGGYGPNDQGGYGPNDQGGYGPNDQGGYGPNDQGGYGPNDQGGYGPDVRGFNANRRAMGAPISSSDGHVSIFNRMDAFGETGTAALQALPAAPNLYPYLTPVGQAYRFEASSIVSRTIEFGYIQREVPQGYEHTLVVWFSGDEGRSWQRLPTALDADDNQATAPADHSGVYVLASAVDVPFYSAGWNLFAYPIPADRPVVEALRSISGTYTTVYGYDSTNQNGPWQVYDTRAPEWANDLTKLEFGRGYWINVSQPVTLQLQVASGEPFSRTAAVAAALTNPVSRRTPPAVYYGSLPGAVVSDSITVTAWIGDQLCGKGLVLVDEQSYVVKVDAADEGATAGCGAPGKRVTFKLGETVVKTVDWDNTAPKKVDLKCR